MFEIVYFLLYFKLTSYICKILSGHIYYLASVYK